MPIKLLVLKPALRLAWSDFIHPELEKFVKSSENELDDKGLEMLNVLVEHLLK
jgi:hypothetical protein